ncbi:MAG: hypothetical protein II718_08725 [Clostridiales bacterium]|nr:hypothetical protein [Clostridiales bacterium]
MPNVEEPISLRCTVCGGVIVNDYLSASCVCGHCGNKWSMDEMLPGYRQYAKAIEQLGKANEILSQKTDVVSAGQAKLMFQRASSECSLHPDAIALELLSSCEEGIRKADQIITYSKGKKCFDNRDYSQAIEEFQKIPGYKDADRLITECKSAMEEQHAKRLPLAIAVSTVLPAILCIFLHEKAGFPVPAAIPLFLILSAGLAYLVHQEKISAFIITILSLACAVPLLFFVLLAYVFHVDTVPAVILSIVIPLVISGALSLLAGKTKNTGN